MKCCVFTPLFLSAQEARRESGIRAAACLATDTYPRTVPISPSDTLIPRRQVHSRFDLAPRMGLQLLRSAR